MSPLLHGPRYSLGPPPYIFRTGGLIRLNMNLSHKLLFNRCPWVPWHLNSWYWGSKFPHIKLLLKIQVDYVTFRILVRGHRRSAQFREDTASRGLICHPPTLYMVKKEEKYFKNDNKKYIAIRSYRIRGTLDTYFHPLRYFIYVLLIFLRTSVFSGVRHFIWRKYVLIYSKKVEFSFYIVIYITACSPKLTYATTSKLYISSRMNLVIPTVYYRVLILDIES